jgi:hypothetical protein
MQPEFKPFPKMPRLSRECIITEKIDGTNASILITEIAEERAGMIPVHKEVAIIGRLAIYVGSRTRWITPDDDNFGFAAWVFKNAEAIANLGVGHHFGEWWGSGIQRGYGLTNGEKRFSLFNVARWTLHGTEPQQIPTADPRIMKMQDVLPACCGLVPVLYQGMFDTEIAEDMIWRLRVEGSKAAPGYKNPEGIVVFHVAGNFGFKKTIEKDEEPKGKNR